MFAVRELRGAALALFAAFLIAQPASAAGRTPGVAKLTLINGWKTYPGSAPASVSAAHGIVRLKGAIKTDGSDASPFVLPPLYRPAGNAYVPVTMCNATNGRLIIDTSGNVTVQAEHSFSDAACLTSLDGASFSTTAENFRMLKLRNGWQHYGGGTTPPAARKIDGIVHFEGSIANGTDPLAFILPLAMRPASVVYTKIDAVTARNARLEIQPSGQVYVEGENGFSDVQAFSSLDGAKFAADASGVTALDLLNGWETYGGSATPAVKVVNGVVYFEGAIRTDGSSAQPFILPAAFRPVKRAYVPVDMCDATNGRLVIESNGEVTVEAETNFTNAACFTSLDGASFHL
jgi:hypothetical protein